MKQIFKITFCALLITGVWACSNDDPENINEPITAEDTDNIASIDEAASNYLEVVTLTNEIVSDMNDPNGRIQQCYSVAETQNQNEVIITFEQGCTSEDGRQRSGSLLLSWSGEFFTPDYSYTLTFDGYNVDGYIPEGSITTTDWVFASNSFSFTVVVNDGLLTCPDGKQLAYEQDLSYQFSSDETIELTIDGSITGSNKDGVTYVASVQEPLTFVLDCEYVVSGSFTATFNGRPAVTVDYGDGTCDDLATVSRGNQSLTFNLD